MLTLKLQCADLGKPNCHALHSPAGGCILLGVRLPFRATSYRGSTSLLVGFDLPSAFQSTESRHVYCKPSFPQCHSPACYSIQRTSSFCELFGNQSNGLLSVRFPFPSVTPNGLCSRQAGDCERLSSEYQQADLEQQNCNSNASPGWRLHFVGGSPVPSSRFFSFHKLTIPTSTCFADHRFGTFPIQPLLFNSANKPLLRTT